MGIQGTLRDAKLLEFACDFKSDLEGLFVVEPRVNLGLVSSAQV
jgi:hypothetical protein